jgi:hypothetical protein
MLGFWTSPAVPMADNGGGVYVNTRVKAHVIHPHDDRAPMDK